MGKKPDKLCLAIDTSGRKGSVAVGIGDEILEERQFSGMMKHSAELFGTIDGMVQKAGFKAENIDNIYVTAGPGSFTGLRIGLTMAKMVSLVNGCKIAALSTLDVLSLNAAEYISGGLDAERLAVILDAKRGQFFASLYEKNISGWTKIAADHLTRAGEFVELIGVEKKTAVLGEGLVYYREQFEGENIIILPEESWYPQASKAYILGRQEAKAGNFTDARSLVPIYLRGPDAKVKKQR